MNNFQLRLISALIGGGILIGGIMSSANTFLFLFVLVGILTLVELLILIRKTSKYKALPVTSAYTIIGFFFIISIPFIEGAYNYLYVFMILFLIWANDSGAYLIGKNFGKTKLWEAVSPKKTWEGFAGGMIVAIAAGLLMNYFWELFSIINVIALSVITVVFGTLGDLLESRFKRKLQVKDSGSMIPGHGGFLDRFDSLLLAAPFFYFYLKIFILK